MMKIQFGVWKNVVIAAIFVAEPILFAVKIPAIPIFWLEQTWIIQAIIGFCLGLIGLSLEQAFKATLLGFLFVGETFMFTSNDRAAALTIICLLFSFPLQVFIGFYWIFLSPKIPTWSVPRRIITIVLAFIGCLGVGILLISSPWGSRDIRNTAQMGDGYYYLTSRLGRSGPGCDFFCGFRVPELYKCNSMGLACELVFTDDFIDISESGLVVDSKENELKVFLSYYSPGTFKHSYGLFYVYGKEPRFVTDSVEFNGSIYYLMALQTQADDDAILSKQKPFTYFLYQCNQDSFNCERLRFSYANENNDDIAMHIDDTGKLSILADNHVNNSYELLVYTYNISDPSSKPLCHVTGCSTDE